MRTATAEQMGELDRRAIEEEGISSTLLMERAARAVAQEVLKLLTGRQAPQVAVLCGPGNNGGDGVAATRFLLENGVYTRAFLVGDRAKLTPDTAEMERRLVAYGGKLENFTNDDLWFKSCDLFVDAVVGIGLRSRLRGEAAKAVALLEQYGSGKAVAVDIASGVDADTGVNLGNNCQYVKTVTFTLPKIGHYVGHGGVICGELVVSDIGIPAHIVDSLKYPVTTMDESLVGSFLPCRDPAGHKGDFGKVHIVGGSIGYTGAAVLAARAALRTGSGLVSLSVPSSIYGITAVKCDEVMPFPLPCGEGGLLTEEALPLAIQAIEGKDVCLIGPGLGRSEGAEALVCGLLTDLKCTVVVDADGLNVLSAHMDRLDIRKDRLTILTPHDGEFFRLGGNLSEGNRLGSALAFARKYGCILVLKGKGTITALPDGRAFLNTTGNSGMAKGGSGDLLAGMILSLVGQGIQPEKAAATAVWLHGRAGDLAAAEKGEYGMIPSDLLERIPHAIQEVAQ